VIGNQVRLGISAPADVRVYRQEVHERIKAEGAESQAALAPIERPG
jgi:carbon storage regulator CsrA